METKTLRAHFDGSHIRLDEPFELTPDDELLITVLPTESRGECEDWAGSRRIVWPWRMATTSPSIPET